MIHKLQFWTLLVGVIGYAVRFFYPDFPLDNEQILAGVLLLLGLIGVVPTVRAIRAKVYGATWKDLLTSLPFLSLVSGLIGFVVRYYQPDFPFSDAVIFSVVAWFVARLTVEQLAYSGFIED